MGPVLFLLYANDLNTYLKDHLVQHADDTSVDVRAKTTQLLDSALQSVALLPQQRQDWGAKLEAKKSADVLAAALQNPQSSAEE
ncbi:hypothetical protein J6590_072392 [Homalodisca vitripennis]|nr:hypothetical protein J6590_072392 [Homalodisca vitripennis]